MTEHVLSLSNVVQDYLKAIWQATEWEAARHHNPTGRPLQHHVGERV